VTTKLAEDQSAFESVSDCPNAGSILNLVRIRDRYRVTVSLFLLVPRLPFFSAICQERLLVMRLSLNRERVGSLGLFEALKIK
jgi:hypothetical protein